MGINLPLTTVRGMILPRFLNDLQHAEHREFAPLYADIGFKNPDDSDSRAKKPKSDDPDYAIKLALHNAFFSERDVWTELTAVRKDFSTVVSAVSQGLTGQTSSATFRSTGRTSTFDASTRSTLPRVIPCMIPHSGSLGMRRWSSPRSKNSSRLWELVPSPRLSARRPMRI